jgi:hypothetical protein
MIEKRLVMKTSASINQLPRLDLIVNVLLFVACAAVALAVLQRSSLSAEWVSRAAPGHELSVGGGAEDLPGVAYSTSHSTLVLYVKSSCHFCTASMPFFRKLNEARRAGLVRLVVVSSENHDITEGYLQQNGLNVDQIVSHQGRIHSTPTLLEVGQNRVVKNAWVGQQTTEQQQRILATVLWR